MILTAFKDNLPNTIRVLNDYNIADINKKDEDGNTPLQLAVNNHKIEVIKLLRTAQNTPLVAAANSGAEESRLEENTLSPETIQLEEAPDIETSKKQRCLPKSCTIM